MRLYTRSEGFTLLEVLVALAILAISMMAVIKVAQSAVIGQTHIEERVVAQWVASNQLTLFQLSNNLEPNKTLNGVEQMAGLQWRWQVLAQNTDSPDIYKVIIKVMRAEAEEQSSSLIGYLRAKQ